MDDFENRLADNPTLVEVRKAVKNSRGFQLVDLFRVLSRQMWAIEESRDLFCTVPLKEPLSFVETI